MSIKEYLRGYIPLVDFLSKVCGPSCEIVLHDVTDKENSIIYIVNSKTNRQEGGALTDLACSLLSNEEYADKDFITNYSGVGKGKKFLSSTYFIKKEKEIIGMLCVNRDLESSEATVKALNFLMEQNNLYPFETTKIKETLEDPVTHLVTSSIEQAFDELNKNINEMTSEDKIVFVKKLSKQGVLKMKGAVDEIAERLNVSKPTIYRYINSK